MGEYFGIQLHSIGLFPPRNVGKQKALIFLPSESVTTSHRYFLKLSYYCRLNSKQTGHFRRCSLSTAWCWSVRQIAFVNILTSKHLSIVVDFSFILHWWPCFDSIHQFIMKESKYRLQVTLRKSWFYLLNQKLVEYVLSW